MHHNVQRENFEAIYKVLRSYQKIRARTDLILAYRNVLSPWWLRVIIVAFRVGQCAKNILESFTIDKASTD